LSAAHASILPASTDNEPVAADIISHYRILERIGSGGMGEVFRAEDLRLHRFVALKTLCDADTLGREGVARLLAEARAASVLNHPNIAVIYDAGEIDHDGQAIGFIAMELVQGTTVAALVHDGPLPIDRVLDIVEPVADALADAHEHGLVHRDIKPSNVMVTPAGRVKLLDFGVAQRRASASRPIESDDSTRTGDIAEAVGFVGTLPYVAPEQATRREVDGRADIFSLGVMLYELISGKPPFTGENAAQLLEAILRDDMPPLPALPDPRAPQLERLLRSMLARDPDRRIANAREVQAALVAIRTGERLPAAIDRGNEPARIAIAAFRNISGNVEDDWLGTGIAETLTADVAQLEGVAVIPRQRVSESIRTISQ
jgi:serine/threonine protein kinase